MSEIQGHNPVIERVHLLVAPIVADLGLELYDLEFTGGVLKIVVDTQVPSGQGVSLDTIALITRLVSREFDHSDPMPGRYTLEVTSPGLERTLRLPRHFQREVGKIVALRLHQTLNGERRIQGHIVAADEVAVTIRTDEATNTDIVVPYQLIDRARTVFQWGPTPKQSIKGTRRRTQSTEVTAS
ncbi:MAG: ribosome maturation factor RimP [Ilumatobacteraceae bacterium]